MNVKRLWRKRYLLIAGVLVLAASHFARRAADRPAPDAAYVQLPSVAGTNTGPATVFVAVRDLGPRDAGERLPVVLVHGSPMKSFDLGGLAALLAFDRRVLLPDLPGFGRSQRFIPDYSMKAHGRYLLALLDELGIPRAHVVAYSQGGGAALWLNALDPSRVASLTLLASIGVQELELLGNYELNHGIHGVQLAACWAAATLLPHFGWLDRMMLNEMYARNFYESDQRPLRAMLANYGGPTLILHGRDDALVPPAAAVEHQRILPQSEMEWIEGGHMAALFRPETVAPDIAGFLARADRGEASSRAEAAPERVAQAGEAFADQSVEPASGLALLIVVTLIALATFISEDLACIGAGLMAAAGSITFTAAAFASFLGIFVGDLLLFFAGRYIGQPALRRAPVKWFVKESALEESAAWFQQKGPWAIVLSRFVPGSRLPTYFAAGLLHTSLLRFLVFFIIAGIVWAPLLVWVAMIVGGRILEWLEAYKTLTLVSVAATAILIWVLIELVVPLFSFKGRRLLVSAWRRKTRWEFWPPWIFYPPLFAYILWLGIRHRGLTVFSACNPAIPAGGFIGESKAKILEGLAGAAPWIARWRLIKPDGKAAENVDRFMREEGLSYPVVLKPDVGQRGLGVAVAKSDADVRAYFTKARGDVIAQEFIGGLEYGVFYYRYPEEDRGHILSITDKRFPHVTGDGANTLERLILKDDRAVCMAHFFLRKFKERAFEVPADGKRVDLVELGTHCRGAVFYDGISLVTPELEKTIDEISKTFEGFHFGRYDVRVPSVEEFRAGRGFKIIELNGVTAEATAIYNPGASILWAYRLLARQWRTAFEIGAANRARGAKPASVKELLRSILDYEPVAEA